MASCSVAGGSAAELALEAWADCRPEGYIADERHAADAALAFARRRLEGCAPSAVADIRALFEPSGGAGQPNVLQMLLRAHDGKVHFLYFWKTIREVARIAESNQSEGLTSELETLRDEVLRILEESVRDTREEGGPRAAFLKAVLPTQLLVEALNRAASMSAEPQFWEGAADEIRRQQTWGWFTLHEIAGLHMWWLNQIVIWEYGESRGYSTSISQTPEARLPEAEQGLPVLIHIYDVSQENSIQKVNKVLAHEYAPLKLGGIFHAGVEVNGLEWSFGFTPKSTKYGVFCNLPKENKQHHYRESVRCRYTKLSAEKINSIITELAEEWKGPDYDLLRRNCCHFADEFCKRLEIGGIPGWVHRLARIGARLDNMINGSERDDLPVVAAGARERRR